MAFTHDFKRFPELTNSQMGIYYFDSPHKQIAEDFFARVVKVSDGDTIRVLWDDRDFTFPIRFIDTESPELKEQGGPEAQRWLEGLILNEEVDIIIDFNRRVEKWGRLLGRILHRGMDINEQSIRDGFAVPWIRRNELKKLDINRDLNIKQWL